MYCATSQCILRCTDYFYSCKCQRTIAYNLVEKLLPVDYEKYECLCQYMFPCNECVGSGSSTIVDATVSFYKGLMYNPEYLCLSLISNVWCISQDGLGFALTI